jgi:UDP-N-acetylmuramyl pentapeptide phosphotransferase/UDP-N-acetylglucosamine-1-phosphate transferase/glycosyltransferase involved in cell wall biosynthesis
MMPTIANILAFAIAFTVSLVFTPLTARAARALGIFDVPDARKIHQKPTPRIGGVAICAAVLAAVVPILIFTRSRHPAPGSCLPLLALLAGAVFVLIVGVLDDLRGVRSTYKLAVILLAAFLLWSAGGSIDSLVVRGHKLLDLGRLSWPITMFWIVGITVSINFIDGLDGLAAGIVAIAAAVIAVGAAATHQFAVAIVTLSLAGSLCGFLFFNFNPASIFMGDSGSMFIGFVLAGASVLCTKGAGANPDILLPVIVLIIPLLDTNLTFIRRGILQRRSIFSPERGHIHHRLLGAGLCHKHAVILLYAITLCAAATALLLRFASTHLAVTAVVLLLMLVGILFRVSGSSHGRDTVAAIRRNRAISRESGKYRAAFEDAQLRFRNARTFDDWWANVRSAAGALDLAAVVLPLVGRDGTTRVLSWHGTPVRGNAADTSHISGNGHFLRPRPSPLPARASLPVRDRRSGPPLLAEVELATNSTLESAGHRIALFARLMEEHSLATLPDEMANQKPAVSDAQEPSYDRSFEPANSDSPTANLRVAIVHDFLYTYAGAERVLEQILAIYPQADLFSLFDFLPPGERGFIQNKSVTASFLQRLPFARNHHRAFLPLMPMAIEQLNVFDYDLVISSSYCAAKGVITSPRQLHVCYCHTPVRYAWDLQTQYTNQRGIRNRFLSFVARAVFHYIRTWDVRSANGVDIFITNSQFVGQRVQKTYRRRSTVVHPPVDTEFFTPRTEKNGGGVDGRPDASDFYLTASRLVSYKRIDLIVEAFKRLPDKKLIVIGEGPDMAKIQALAGPNVRLLGHQSAERLLHYMRLARGFVFAAEEDFGIVPVEAMSCGTPVIAYAQGGALETILPGHTGLFFKEQTVDSLTAAIAEFEQIHWNRALIRTHAERFSIARFRSELATLIDREWTDFQVRRQIGDHAVTLAEQLMESVGLASPPPSKNGNGHPHPDPVALAAKE